MGSPHPKAPPAASQEGSSYLHELFKKEGLSWRFEGDIDGLGTIVAGGWQGLPPQTHSPSNGVRL